MPHTKVSRAIADVRRQLRTGQTRSKRPRPLTTEEVQALQHKRLSLEAEMRRLMEERALTRIRRTTPWVAAVAAERVEQDVNHTPPEVGCGFP